MVVLESLFYLQSYGRRKLDQIQLNKTTSCLGYKGPSMTDWTKNVLWLLLGSPIPALIYCLYAAYTSDRYENAVRTQCGVSNFAISVSEATSVPNMSKDVWTYSIVLHVYPRIFQANLIFKTFNETLQQHGNVFQYAWWFSWIYVDW